MRLCNLPQAVLLDSLDICICILNFEATDLLYVQIGASESFQVLLQATTEGAMWKCGQVPPEEQVLGRGALSLREPVFDHILVVGVHQNVHIHSLSLSLILCFKQVQSHQRLTDSLGNFCVLLPFSTCESLSEHLARLQVNHDVIVHYGLEAFEC